MNRVVSLGSLFFAFIGGAVIGAAVNIATSALFLEDLPDMWWALAVSSVLLVVSSVVFSRLAIQLRDLEVSLTSVPVSLGMEERKRIMDSLVAADKKRMKWNLWIAFILAAAGIGILPVRVFLS